jgi:predicted NACHT family NTPase
MLEAAATWAWEKYGKQLTDKAGAAARELWARFRWHESEREYRERLLEHYSTTKLLGNPKEIRLDQTYVDAHVFNQVSAFQRVSIERLRQLSSHKETEELSTMKAGQEISSGNDHYDSGSLRAKRIPLKQLALKEQRLYVLGKPGAGKSTFLKHITLLCCKGDIKKTPIFVPLKSWSDSGLTLIAFIEREFEICKFPSAKAFIEALLNAGEAIVLFDGLDEVNQEGDRRQKMIELLTQFARKYPNIKMVVTCRIAATDYSFEKFKYVEIADFTEEQQDQLAANWYLEQQESLGRFREEWNRPDNAGLRQLARTPLLLALMCLAFDETLSFPRRRVEVYQEALNALLKKWDSSRGIVRDAAYRRLSIVRKEQLLSRIAAETFKESEFVIERKRVLQIIDSYLAALPPSDRDEAGDAEAVLQAMEVQHGILIERAFGIFSFSHLTFHEYFTARYVVDNASSGEVTNSIRGHAEDDQWREVFLLIASLIDNGDMFLGEFLKALRTSIRGKARIARLLSEVDRSAKEWRERGGKLQPLRSGGQALKLRRSHKGQVFANLYLDAVLSIAAELAQSGVVESSQPLWRARYLAAILQATPARIGELFRNDAEELTRLAAYLRATQLFVECMNVATARDRRMLEQQVLAPSA